MHPVLVHLVVPAGLGKAVALAVVVLVLVVRAVAAMRRARREGEALSFLDALRGDLRLGLVLVAAVAVLWARGVLDRRIDLPLHSYGLLLAAAFLTAIWLAQREARHRGQDPERIADLGFWVLVSALVGSRLYFIFVNWDDYFGSGFLVETPVGRIPRLLAVWEGGLVFYGGFIGAALTSAWYMRRHAIAFLPIADTAIPSVAFGHFLGRLGCFFAGCCWGDLARADLPWATRFPRASLAFQSFAGGPEAASRIAPGGATTVPLHPTQLYESFGELALFLFLVLAVRPRKRFHGQVLATWLLLYAVLRFVVELFRGDVERGVWAGLGAGQWTSLVIFAAGVLVWVRGRKARPALAPAAAA
jgi:phosphatidylglycerol:prolipoprotein diacylglycerol transferase